MQKRKSFLLTFVKVSEKIYEASKGLESGVKWTREIAECVGCDWGSCILRFGDVVTKRLDTSTFAIGASVRD